MKLPRENIDKIAGLVLARLKDRGLLVFKADEKTVLARITSAIVDDLKAEESLDREVEELLRAHGGGSDSDQVDYRKMFSMVKHKLARERGIVL